MRNQELLQSELWIAFQEKAYGKTFKIESESFLANILKNKLPLVGGYFYIPRGPIYNLENKSEIKNSLNELIILAKKEKAGWIRFEPKNFDFLDFLKNNKINIAKAPQDIQPAEIFVLDITQSEEELLSKMKPKTRYNIRLAQKKGVQIKVINKDDNNFKNYFDKFIELIHSTSNRKGIKPHKRNYYAKMIEIFPVSDCKLYVAEFNGEIISVNLMIYFAGVATYLHGGSSDNFRNLMSPFLLQWQAILDAKKEGYFRYDFGGVDTSGKKQSWQGITRFKQGFAPQAQTIDFPGTYDIIISPLKYGIYRIIKSIKNK